MGYTTLCLGLHNWKECQSSYKKKALETHPDRFPRSQISIDESNFNLISKAYTCLQSGTFSTNGTYSRVEPLHSVDPVPPGSLHLKMIKKFQLLSPECRTMILKLLIYETRDHVGVYFGNLIEAVDKVAILVGLSANINFSVHADKLMQSNHLPKKKKEKQTIHQQLQCKMTYNRNGNGWDTFGWLWVNLEWNVPSSTQVLMIYNAYSILAQPSTILNLRNEDFQQMDGDDLEELDLRWQVAMLTVKVKKFIQRTGRNMDFKEKRHVSLNKSKIECYNCHRKGHFARECTGGSNRSLLRLDWSNDFEVEPDNYALMAISSSNLSSSSDSKCRKSGYCGCRTRIQVKEVVQDAQEQPSENASPNKGIQVSEDVFDKEETTSMPEDEQVGNRNFEMMLLKNSQATKAKDLHSDGIYSPTVDLPIDSQYACLAVSSTWITPLLSVLLPYSEFIMIIPKGLNSRRIINSADQTRGRIRKASSHNKPWVKEPKTLSQALKDESWVEAMQEESAIAPVQVYSSIGILV
ncbi:ribonuclease H-like domain-containing protein [Tanacetum coccineum]